MGRVAPILIPPRLFKIIHIFVIFKKLNGTGRGEMSMRNSHHLTFFLNIFKKITFKFFNYIKINIFYKKLNYYIFYNLFY